MSETAISPAAARWIRRWLILVGLMVYAMILIGGATRLTDSGLSITEWDPIKGAIPPLSAAAWNDAFTKYQTTAEYRFVNQGMSLADFQQIYWWEWGHRFFGRMIGLVAVAGLAFFALKRWLTRRLAVRILVLILLGGLQGAIGWWMVSSGLTERVDVSQYRLAAHLALAVLLFAAIFWIALDLLSAPRKKRSPLAPFAFALAAGVYAQMILGAFVAGLRAGRTFNTWPLMDGKIFPDGYFSGAPGLNDLFETAAASQFNHRLGAYLLAAAVAAFYVLARKTDMKARAQLLLVAVLAQVVLGIWTIVAATPIALGLAHQAGALIVLCCALYAAHGSINSIEMTGSASVAA